MEIYNEKKYRLIADKNKDYIVDLSLSRWSCLCGLYLWLFPIYGYSVGGDQIINKNKKMNVVLKVILYVMVFFCVILAASALEVLPIHCSIQQKLLFCIVVYILSWLSGLLSGRMAQKKFYLYNSKNKNDVVKIKLYFTSKVFLLKLFLSNLIINFMIIGGLTVGFIVVPGTEGMLPCIIILIYTFVSYSEITRTPFTRDNIKEIKVLGNKFETKK